MDPCKRCPCGGHYDDRSIEVRLARQGVRLRDVRQSVCPRCGSRVYARAVLHRIEAAYREDPVDPAVGRTG